MKAAIISDIHGNMQALKKVLADIDKEQCEKIFCLGDLAMGGPEPDKTIELIKKLYDEGKLELIQGNTDEMIWNYKELSESLKKQFPVMSSALDDDVKIIPGPLKTFLKTLPKQKTVQIQGVKILLVHGSPRKNNENISPDLPVEKVEEMLVGTDADIIFCGHTHIPCGYQTRNNQTIVNTGSVGRPFTQDAKACYVIADFNDAEFDIMHKQLDYDKDIAAKILAKRKFDGADKLAEILLNPEFRHL